jgi:PAS domain S-box-containing protein
MELHGSMKDLSKEQSSIPLERVPSALSPLDERIHSAIIQQSPVGVSVRDRNGNLVLCNPRWADIWEKTVEEVQKALDTRKDRLEMDGKDLYLGKNREVVQSIYRNGGDVVLEPILVSSLGKWVQQRFYGIEGASGAVEYVVVLTEDVTAAQLSRFMEQELHRSNERYSTLVQNLPVAAYTTNAEGMCISGNPAMVKMFEEESLDRLYSIPVLHRYRNPSDRKAFTHEILSRGRVDGYEVELVTSTGRPFLASISATATHDENGELQYIDGIIRDISLEKALEDEILKNQKLESIGLLAGGIAHDFNNIMASVLGNISLARLNCSNQKAMEKLEQAEKFSIKASELTRQLLTFSRGGKPHRKPADLCRTIKEAAVLAAKGSGCSTVFHLAEDIGMLMIDEAQIGQVVGNMVLNAVQAMGGSGRVDISAERVVPHDARRLNLEQGEYVRLMVRDHGKGIPSEIRKQIFDPYFSTRPGGAGLGLPVAYSVIRNHGGCIVLDSSSETGTCLSVYIPLIPVPEGSTRDQSTVSQRGAGRILVMDDEQGIRQVVKEILEEHGYDVDTASCGEEAVRLFRLAHGSGSPYNVVITDVTVPGGMGGVETLKAVLAVEPNAKVIVASGYSNNDEMANFRQFGFADSLAKPFTLDSLLDVVSRSL